MISEDDRSRVIEVLRDQAGAGTLDLDEYGARLSEAYAATTVEELRHSLRDLPVPALSEPAPAPPPPPAGQAVSTPRSTPRPHQHQHPHRPHTPLSPAKVDAAARAAWGAHLGAYVSVNLMLVVIWLLTGAGYFWPMWPIMGWGIGLTAHGMAHSGAMRARARQRRLNP
jgi:hypothetical protein